MLHFVGELDTARQIIRLEPTAPSLEVLVEVAAFEVFILLIQIAVHVGEWQNPS
jgi:hypothetical protein